MPWKNGGGETTEIAVFPEGASLDDFGWRISRARVERSGPFSPFPGIDRTIVTVDGEGIVLRPEGKAPVRLTRDAPPFSFAGETPIESDVIGGAVIDLNAMTRRGRFRHRLTVVDGAEPFEIAAKPGETIALLPSGRTTIRTQAGEIELSANDAVLLTEDDGRVNVRGVRLYLVRIEP
jgi:environmental stress-induced protein Ves